MRNDPLSGADRLVGNEPLAETTGPASYSILAAEVRHELVVKRSRFITVLRRVETEDQARLILASLRRDFHDARHHCSAFVLGPDRAMQRSHDDGEPSGTAGAPMLEAITRRETFPGAADLSDVCAVVVRYFGGTLLGAGPLARAYSDSVSQALDGAELLRRQRMRRFSLGLPHAEAARLDSELRGAGLELTGARYEADQTVLGVALPDEPGRAEALAHRIAALTGGAARLVPDGTAWMDQPHRP